MRQKTVTQEQVFASLHYDPETGVFTRRSHGGQVGRKGWNGYLSIDLKGRPYRAHRLAWLYMTGEWPDGSIDHKDGDTENNRFNNLREATRGQNMFNAKAKDKVSNLPRGVKRPGGRGKHQACIKFARRKIHLGTFDTAQDASEFYQLAAEMLHGSFAYHLGQGAQRAAALKGE